MGDFNAVLGQHEKWGGQLVVSSLRGVLSTQVESWDGGHGKYRIVVYVVQWSEGLSTY